MRAAVLSTCVPSETSVSYSLSHLQLGRGLPPALGSGGCGATLTRPGHSLPGVREHEFHMPASGLGSYHPESGITTQLPHLD